MPSPAPISHSPTLPRLPETDHRLFSLYASLRLDLHALADQSGRDMAELTAWAAAPEIRLWAEAYHQIAGHSLITTAIAALVETMKATENLIEKRRAAQAILRAHQTPRRQPTFSIAAAAPVAASSPPSPAAGGRGARAAGGEGSVSTPPTQPPRATTSPTQPLTTPRLSSPLPTPNSPLTTAFPSPFAFRPSPRPTSRLTTAAGLATTGYAGPAP